ncbi:uncharacterized protein LOC118617390 isoform X1 [Molossus molossus]|uniref:uncharacterized protein LOC118617390 isoform X1 n=1 Tax=Molossus molossus TaxID=27622 RepID=UPI001746A9F5|nr:uncharacterized protein LOC118617390 isoform X1 [Molossus molossus]
MPPSLPAPRLFVLSTIPAQHLWAPRMCPQGMLPPRQGAVCLLTLEAGQLARGGPSGHAPRGGGWPGAPLLPAGAAQCQPCPHPAPSVSAREGGRVRQGAAVYLRHRVPRSLRPGPPVAPSVPSVERGAWLAVGSARQAVGHSLSCTCSPVSRGLPRRGAHPASVTPHAGRVVRLLLTPRVRWAQTSAALASPLSHRPRWSPRRCRGAARDTCSHLGRRFCVPRAGDRDLLPAGCSSLTTALGWGWGVVMISPYSLGRRPLSGLCHSERHPPAWAGPGVGAGGRGARQDGGAGLPPTAEPRAPPPPCWRVSPQVLVCLLLILEPLRPLLSAGQCLTRCGPSGAPFTTVGWAHLPGGHVRGLQGLGSLPGPTPLPPHP